MVETIYHLNSPVSIALLTDLHNRPYKDIIRRVEKYAPDIIAVAGDVIYGSPEKGMILKKHSRMYCRFSMNVFP